MPRPFLEERDMSTTTEAIACPHCGGPMIKATKTDKSAALQVLGVLVFLVGLGLLWAFPVGTIFGIVLMIGACKMGHSTRRIRKCQQCGHFYEIA